jgi:hypothetical protein
VESNVGYLEYEMCALLGKTPNELGHLRIKDPLGMVFLERHLLYRLEKEHEYRKKQEQEAKRRSKKGRIGGGKRGH